MIWGMLLGALLIVIGILVGFGLHALAVSENEDL